MLFLLDETAGNLPVQDTDQKPSIIAALQDVSSSALIPAKSERLKIPMKGSSSLAKTRHQINRVSRAELANSFLRLRDGRLLLKESTQKQEENKIKRHRRMGTKLSRLSHERAQANGRPGSCIQNSVRNLDLEEGLEEMQERVWDLEQCNQRLRSHLLFYKQQLQLQGCGRHCPYGYVTAKVNTGFRRAHTSARQGPKKSHKGMQVSGMTVRPTSPRYADDVLERSQAETERLSHSLVLAELDKNHELLSFTPEKETDPENIQPQKNHPNLQEYRTSIQKNVELIRLQKLLWEKNSELVITKAQITDLHDNQQVLRSASEALLAQLDDLNANLKEKTQKVAALESRLEILSPLQGTLEDFQERVQDLEAERDSLKTDYDRLLDSCINAVRQNLDQVPQKDNAPSLEEQLNSVMVEKEILEEQLKKEKAQNEALKQEVSSLQEKAAILENQVLEEAPQSNPTQSEKGSSKVLLSEQAGSKGVCNLARRFSAEYVRFLVRMAPHLKPANTESLSVEVLEGDNEKNEMFAQDSLKRQLHEAEAAHAETVLELEKTRNMVILQHRINRDYQVELERALMQAKQEKQEHQEKQQRMDQLLDLRTARIHQLEERLKDVAYGTRVVPLRPPDSDIDGEAVPGKVLELRYGENLFELHISGAILSAEAVHLLGDPEPLTFCTYAFYDFETHCTPLALGIRPHYNFTSQYVVQADPFFLQYLQGATSRLDLHVASAVDHATLASCWLHFGQALSSGKQVHGTAVLHGPEGEDYGLLEYWVRLHFPYKQILQLHHQPSQALMYLSAGTASPRVAPQSQQQQGDRTEGVSWNELCIQIKSCANLRSRWLGSQPSSYAMYQFFTFPDHDTVIIPSSNTPHFGDVQTFTLPITPELHQYLLVESLWVYVFDDEEEEPGSYLGKAQIPLVPLAHGHSIKGDFGLMDPAGKPSGSIHLSLEWKVPYLPLEDAHHKATQSHSLKMQIADEQNMLQSQVPEKHLQKSSKAKNGLEFLSAQVIPTRELKRSRTKEEVGKTIPKMELEEKTEEEEEILEVGEKARMEENQGLDVESILAAVPKDTGGEEQDTSEAQTTESDEVVVGLPTPQECPDLQPSDWIRVEVISLGLLPESQPIANEAIQQLYVEFHFPGVPLEETETAFSLRKPSGDQEVYFHFSKVIKLDPDPGSFQRQMLFSMLAAEEPQWNKLQFIVVSEPLPGARGECEEVGFSCVDLREILLTGNDLLEQELQDRATKIGKLNVSVEAAAALRAIYRAGKRQSGKESGTEEA